MRCLTGAVSIDVTPAPSVKSLTVDATALTIVWDDGAEIVLPWIWVRDHSHDAATLHPTTHQRDVFTAGLDPQLRGASARVDGRNVVVEWTGAEPDSVLPVAFLNDLRDHGSSVEACGDPVLWDRAAILDAWPVVGHDRVMASDDGVREWLDLVGRYGFCIVEGTPPTAAATEALIERIGYVRATIFGGFWEFEPDRSRDDAAYTDEALRPHTDGTYSHDAPGLQILHCLGHDGDGGESTMVDGFRIAEELRRTAPHHYDVLAKVDVPGQYLGDGVHLKASRPVFRHDGDGRLVQVSFNNADRAPFLLPPDEMVAFYDALRAFERLVDEPDLRWERRNPPGDALVFDNWRVLHGRTAFTGARRLCGAYVNREDVESRRRVLA
jgi:trimethyllysine dioxygenase